MARVVIDIPDDNYKRIRELAEVNGLSNNLMGYSLLAIAHGTVLPKGKWKYIRAAYGYHIIDTFVCPFCDYERKYYPKNFCEECGADLRGEKADENS